MNAFLQLLRTTAVAIISFLELAMLVRAIMSWFPFGEDNKIGYFTYVITEPFVIPVRNVLERFEFVRNFPVDIPFFATFLLLAVIEALIS